MVRLRQKIGVSAEVSLESVRIREKTSGLLTSMPQWDVSGIIGLNPLSGVMTEFSAVLYQTQDRIWIRDFQLSRGNAFGSTVMMHALDALLEQQSDKVLPLLESMAGGKTASSTLTRSWGPLLKRAAAEWAEYKGKKYKVLWIGKTKFGERAHLQFADGSKDFWVDARQVSLLSSGSFSPGRGRGPDTCAECGAPLRGRGREAPDSSGMMGVVCPSCARLPRWERSYM